MSKLEQLFELAKRYLASRPYEGKVRFRGFTLEHFDESELRKIVELAVGYIGQGLRLAESERQMSECFSRVSSKMSDEAKAVEAAARQCCPTCDSSHPDYHPTFGPECYDPFHQTKVD